MSDILERIVLWLAQTTSSEVAQLDEARELANDAAGEIESLRQRLAAAEDRVEKLREAIKPFAEFSRLLGDFRDVDSVIRRKSWLVSDFRKASEAYGDD